jgi:hypothetical protein
VIASFNAVRVIAAAMMMGRRFTALVPGSAAV